MGDRSFKLTDFIVLSLSLFLINFVIGLIFKIDIFIELSLVFTLNEIMLFMILEEMYETYSLKKEYEKLNYENLDDFKYIFCF